MKKRILSGYLCLFIMISVALAGCYTRLDKPGPRPHRSMPPLGHPIKEPPATEASDSPVQVSLTVSFHSVCRSDPIKVRVNVTNPSDHIFRLGRGHCPVFFLVADNQGECRAYIYGSFYTQDNRPKSYFYLEPGESCSKSWPWEALVTARGSSRFRLLPAITC